MKNCIVLDTCDRIFHCIGIKKPIYKLVKSSLHLPTEKFSPVAFGLLVHLCPTLFFILLVNLSSPLLLNLYGAFLATSLLTLGLISLAENKYPSVILSTLTMQDRLRGLSLVFITASVIGTLFVLGGVILLKSLHPINRQYYAWNKIILTLMSTDLAYYWIHRTLSHSKKKNFIVNWFRKNHAPHHAIKVLDFYRGNLSTFLDTAIISFQIPLIIIATLLGLQWQEAIICYFLILILQSTHHANHSFNIGFMRYLFVDNHSHKLHHCPRGYDVNFGAIFSIWDIFFRTYYENWQLSASYLAKNHIALPLKRNGVV